MLLRVLRAALIWLEPGFALQHVTGLNLLMSICFLEILFLRFTQHCVGKLLKTGRTDFTELVSGGALSGLRYPDGFKYTHTYTYIYVCKQASKHVYLKR